VVMPQNAWGTLPTRNYNEGQFELCEQISGETMYDTILKERDTCYACVVRCKRVVEVKEGPLTVDPLYGGPEYETLSTFGSYCGVGDLVAISKANEICNQYGVDTITCGATIAFAMECYEKGIIGKEQTGGLELKFGNAEAMLEVLREDYIRTAWAKGLNLSPAGRQGLQPAGHRGDRASTARQRQGPTRRTVFRPEPTDPAFRVAQVVALRRRCPERGRSSDPVRRVPGSPRRTAGSVRCV
ncbi:MAG: hypothetical protein K6T86_21710, partial [Pirellulales bacterium]|nr:hypothetical protein [Pirellulales bacterium]